MTYNRKDYFFKQAKKKNYAARSIFKLEEIDERFSLIKSGYKILDLGAAPGSWSQYAAQKVGDHGVVIGIDLQPIRITLPNAAFLQANLLDLESEPAMHALLADRGVHPPFDVVISDMAPKTTGVKMTDQARSLELCEMALSLSDKYLRGRGHFVCKMFHGGDFEGFRRKLQDRFGRVEILRPESTRKASKEIFLIGIQKKAKT